MQNFKYLLLVATMCGFFLAQKSNATEINQRYKKVGSEYQIIGNSIYPQMLDRAIPTGAVDINPPWLAYNPWINEPVGAGQPKEIRKSEKREFALNQKLNRRYYFELSRDKAFKKDVIKSAPKAWSFFNPYQKLSSGTWYWRVTFVENQKMSPNFKGVVHSFYISGKERVFVPPSADKMVEHIKERRSPRVIMPEELVGKLWSQLPDWEKKNFSQIISKAEDVKILPYDQMIKVESAGRSEKIVKKLMSKMANDITIKYTTAIDTLVRAYLVRGEEKYKKSAIEKYTQLYRLYPGFQKYYTKKNFMSTFGGARYLTTTMLLLDACSESLEPDIRKGMVGFSMSRMTNGSDNYNVQLARSEYKIYDAHLWQGGVHKPMFASIVLSAYRDDAVQWFRYYYELWLFRSPAGSRNDGGWHAGLGYFGVNDRALLQSAWVLQQVSGFNFYNQPWYKNFSKFLSFSSPINNPRDRFGDFTAKSANVGTGKVHNALSTMQLHFDPDNFWHNWRVSRYKLNTSDIRKNSPLANANRWYLALANAKFGNPPKVTKVASPDKTMQAALFQDLGFVGASSDMSNPENNMHITFRSTPFGGINHSFSAQNSFNLSYGGDALFINTGHRHSTALHQAFDYKLSRAHNTIAPDGIVQSDGITGFGWVPRFVHGEQYTYFVGDASKAYSGDFELNEELDIYKTRKGGLYEAKVTRFRRHVLVIRPNIMIIYDELEAKEPYDWRYKLHSHNKMTLVGPNSVATANKAANAMAHIWGSGKLDINITDKYRFQALNLRAKAINGKIPDFPDSWHLEVSPVKKMNNFKFLTVIEIEAKNGKYGYCKPKKVADDKFIAGDYTIHCNLDSSTPSLLKVFKKNESFGISTGAASSELKVGNQSFKAKIQGTTLFFEKASGKDYVSTLEDTLPDTLKYENIYK
jgi:hypothetical protein